MVFMSYDLYYIPWYRYEVLTNRKRVRFYDENDEVIADMVFEWWPKRNKIMEKIWWRESARKEGLYYQSEHRGEGYLRGKA